MKRQTSRRDFLRKSAFATGAFGLAAATMPGTSLAGCMEVDGCSRTPGYWKNHPDSWHDEHMNDIEELEIGCETYSKEDLLDYLLDEKPKGGNKMVIHTRALIAAKLNIEGGVKDWCLDDDYFHFLSGKDVVFAADQWVCENGGIYEFVKHWNDVELLYPDTDRPYVTDNEKLYKTLDKFNNGRLDCTCPSD